MIVVLIINIVGQPYLHRRYTVQIALQTVNTDRHDGTTVIKVGTVHLQDAVMAAACNSTSALCDEKQSQHISLQ